MWYKFLKLTVFWHTYRVKSSLSCNLFFNCILLLFYTLAYSNIFPLLAHCCVYCFYFDINIIHHYFIDIINKIRKISTNINISVGTTFDNQYHSKSNDVSYQDYERHWENIDSICFNNGSTYITDVTKKFKNENDIIVHIFN